MSKMLQLLINGTFITKVFIITGLLYMITMLVTTFYVYARLDYVRTGVEHTSTQTERANNPQTR